jgi:hypothetical protein
MAILEGRGHPANPRLVGYAIDQSKLSRHRIPSVAEKREAQSMLIGHEEGLLHDPHEATGGRHVRFGETQSGVAGAR